MSLLVSSILLGVTFAPGARPDPPMDLPRPAPVPVPVGQNYVPSAYRGRVVELTDKTVTIKLEGVLQITHTSFHPDGKVREERVYTQDNNQPPKRFVFGEQVLRRPNGFNPVVDGHNASDLRVGDVVGIDCSRWLGVEYCNTIHISRRPGGKVPPAAGDEETTRLGKQVGEDLDRYRWDTRMNAQQAAEERAVRLLRHVGRQLLR